MDPIAHLLRVAATDRRLRWLRWLIGPLAVLAIIGSVLSQTAPPPNPPVTLSAEPLYARGARAKPTLTLALSVEFPTVGAQYLSGVNGQSWDNTYSATTQYPGYFDTESCYVYNDQPTVPNGANAGDYKRFDRLGAATSATDPNPRSCAGLGFSGNMMNWASSSAVDILRYGLTGGDRVIDTTTLTVLQRAVLPNATVSSNFWNGTNFPDKQLTLQQAQQAMPIGMLGTYKDVVHIANCLNRIHFGTEATGSCSYPGNNSDLGITTAGQHGSIDPAPGTPYVGSLPPEFSSSPCASENGTCNFTGTMRVAYGAGTSWYFTSATSPISCSNGVFGDPDVGILKACYLAPDTTGWSPSPWNSQQLTSDGFFYARVSVCDSDSSGNLIDPRTSLCVRYPSGNYKPVGNMQKYSDRLRVAVFGYLNDPSANPNQRYGGVLRVPMKYVGPTYYDQNYNLVSGTNPNEEWDPSTGVFLANPDNNTTVGSGPSYNGPNVSGAINYLNQFGRTGVFGQYKTNDPVSELYYESVRYLQGLQPTPQATSGMTADNTAGLLDGFPITTNWADPQPAMSNTTADNPGNYACFANNIVTIGDIHTHNDASIPAGPDAKNAAYFAGGTSNFSRPAKVSGTGPYSDNQPDFYYWMTVVGGFEAGSKISYLDGNGVGQWTNDPMNPSLNGGLSGMATASPYGDYDSYFMAGIAYWANTHDIRGKDWKDGSGNPNPLQRPGMRITSYMLDVNEFGASSDPSARHINQFFLAAKYGGFKDVTGTGNPFKSSATSTKGDNTDWSGSINGTEATNYFLSSSASAVLSALNTIFAKAASSANSIAGGAISAQSLTQGPGFVYQAQFDPASWGGDLLAYPVSADANGVVTLGDAAWQASLALAAKAGATSPAGASRNIVVGKNRPSGLPVAMNFAWDSLDTTTQAALLTPPYTPGASPDPVDTGQARVLYLRGDQSNEGQNGLKFRTRTNILGDIVNSGVFFMGAPSTAISDSTYTAFYNNHLGRKHALFVGANDGMLHAFDPDHGDGGVAGGDELFAYIPSWVVPNLANLTSPNYVHQSYVDATPAVAEALVGSDWKTVLVGGTGGGGQGVYALDVSDPAAFDASKVLWEFTDADDRDLGNVIGRAQILKFRTSASGASTVTYKYFAVVASGVNNYVNDGHYSMNGAPAIFLLDLAKSPSEQWTQNVNYYKIGGSQIDGSPLLAKDTFRTASDQQSGMVGFTARPSIDGAVAQLYAGDLQGNIWKIDFTQATGGTSDWMLSKLSYFLDASLLPMPLYTAQDASGNPQPITMEPAIINGPNRGIIVSFGTGKFVEVADLASTAQQSVYAIFDNNTATPDTTTSPSSAIKGRSRLQQGSYSVDEKSQGTLTVPSFTWGRPMVDDDGNMTTERSGWYFDFTTSGERQISNFQIVAGKVEFGSVIPPTNSCDNGSGNIYVIDVVDGQGTSTVSDVGIPGQPFLPETATMINFVDTGSTGSQISGSQYTTIQQGAGGVSLPGTTVTNMSLNGRLSWREVTNFQCVKSSPIGICP
ncbi:MAG: pilus assembly protein PilY [Proteobacteria bacterium]|nr:pilus assembly protein PilY [Pseudomonadota bacterium]